MSIPKLPALFAVALATTACIPTLENSRERTAYVSAVAHQAGASTYLLRLTAAFYQTEQSVSSLDSPEVCGGYPYSPLPPTLAFLPTLPAGQYLFTNVGGRTDTLFQSTAVGLTTYQLQSVPGIPFASGDTLTLTVPGDVQGFPALQARVRVAERFDYSPIVAPAEGEPLVLSWTPAPAPGALIVFSLRYNSSGVSDEPDAQVYCVFQDDGAGQVPVALSNAWRVSSVASRSVYASRVRRTTVEVDDRTRLILYSFFDVPTPAIPSP